MADEFSYYWFHRASHECRLFWASHVVHHSSQRYNLSTALRQSWTGTFMGWIFWMWLPLVGFHPVMVLTMQAVSLLYQFWIHTELVHSLGPLEMVLNTPSHHRVHHGSNLRYIDRNHGGTLIVWDRWFGTFALEGLEDRPRFGLTKNIHTYNPVRIAFTNGPTWGAMCDKPPIFETSCVTCLDVRDGGTIRRTGSAGRFRPAICPPPAERVGSFLRIPGVGQSRNFPHCREWGRLDFL